MIDGPRMKLWPATLAAATFFDRTVEEIDALDQVFEATGGRYFQLGSTPVEASRNFADTQLQYRRTGVRPSLSGQVAHYLDQIAFPKNDPHYDAALLVAARAELEHPSRPEYHNSYHSSDVIAATIEFLKKNNVLAVQGVSGAVKLSRQELAIGIIAAAGHDIGHPGGKNALPSEKTAADPFRLERASVSIITPLLEEVGLPSQSIERITTAILATSPDCKEPSPELGLLAADPALRVITQHRYALRWMWDSSSHFPPSHSSSRWRPHIRGFDSLPKCG